MLVITRCTDCSNLLEIEPPELHQRLDDAIAWSNKYNHSKNIRILCPKCSEKAFDRIAKANAA